MGITPLIYLNLCAPLNYSRIEDIPVEISENEELLFYYELDPEQSNSIEPVRKSLPGKLISLGHKTLDSGISLEADIILPAGKYLFTQKPGNSALLKQEEWLDLAVEQQKDALWERYKLKNQLYVRYLYEDGSFVIQLFRSCKEF